MDGYRLMHTKLRFAGVAGICVAGIVAALTLHVVPGLAISSTSLDLPGTSETADVAPRRIELAQATQPVSTLPGGASSLNETYRDWRVTCVQQDAVKRCVLSQSQVQGNGQRVLAIELNTLAGNAVSGALVLPFGLALDSGVQLQIDDKSPSQSVRFRTCVPAGCLVPLSFDSAMIVALRAGSVLKIKAVADGGQDTPFSISLQGFAVALDRVSVLAR